MADTKATEEKDLSTTEGELSTTELEKVSGGARKGVINDPCEGGEYHMQ